ncbi:MAG: hypothetical protein GF353_30000 [Candidatus Lokiarchaeota archaeon]|nr:hypothetical protein [Candidatus Lokiarchaeota archaeon]
MIKYARIPISTLNLSTRAYNCCMSIGINSALDLIHYYISHYTFNDIKNCGTQTNDELINLCTQLLSDSENEDFEISDGIHMSLCLSARARNCINANFENIEALLAYYEKNKSFLKIKNCGVQTERELIDYCNQLIPEQPYSNDEEHNEDFISDIYSNLSESEKTDIDCYFYLKYLFSKPRTKIFLEKLLSSNFSFNSFYEHSNNIDLCKFKNIGKATLKKIDKIKKECIHLSNAIFNYENAFDYFAELLINKFHFKETQCLIYRDDFQSKNLPFFNLINEIVKNLFSEKSSIIFFHRFNYFKNEKLLTLDEISSEINLTRERTRQLQGEVNNELLMQLSNLFICKYFINYSIDFHEDIIIIKDELVDRINSIENVQFTKRFYLKVFHTFGYKNYTVLNEDNKFDENLFLIKRELYDYFDFEEFYIDISERINQRIVKSYTLEFEGYLLKFWKGELQFDLFHRIKKIAEYIIFEEYALIVDIDDKLKILKNTRKTFKEMIPRLIEKENRPLHIDEIRNLLSANHGIEVDIENIDSLRSSILNNDEIVCLSRTSTYGLKKWEKEKKIKGGTIRKIAEEYLEKNDIPKSLYEITAYVNRYRNTTPSNILGNLKADQTNTFYFFESKLIGLTSKKYPNEYYQFKKIPINFYKILQTFFKKNSQKISYEETIYYLSLKYSISKLQIKVILDNYLSRGKLKLVNEKITYVFREQD